MKDREVIDAEFEVVDGPTVPQVEVQPAPAPTPWVDRIAVWISVAVVGGVAVWAYPKLFAFFLKIVGG